MSSPPRGRPMSSTPRLALFSPTRRSSLRHRPAGASEKAIAKRNAAGIDVEFVIGDLTKLHGVLGPFAFVLDYGVLDDLPHEDRAKYVDTLLRLTAPGSQYLLWCFEWAPRWWERPWHQLMAVVPGEVQARFENIS